MRQVEFYKLPRAVQERFLAAAAQTSQPPCWLRMPARTRIPLGWVLSGLAAFGILIGLLALGYGTAGSRLALAPLYMMPIYGVAVWMMALCALGAISALSAPRWLPFRAGFYLFPIGVIDARSTRLFVHPLSELEKVDLVGKTRLALRFKGGRSFTFPLPDPESGSALAEAIDNGKAQVIRLEREDNRHELAVLDPLLETGIPTPLLSTVPLPRRVPSWTHYVLVLALIPALGLAWPIWRIRNVMSERVLFEATTAVGTPEAYRAYIATGGPREEVRELLLPRAELEIAKRSGSVAAVEQVVEKYKGTVVQTEFEQALRGLLLAELAEAKRKRSLTALRHLNRGFSRGDLIEFELQDAIREVYAEALANYGKEAPPGRDDIVAFFRKLLAHAEKHGPRVEIRFKRELRSSVEDADLRVRKSEYYAGMRFIPSRYFDDQHAAKREKRIADKLIARFDQLFPPDVLKVELGAPLSGDAPVPAMVNVPTIFITHSTLMSGAYNTRSPMGIYVGVGVVFDGSFRLPREAQTIDYHLSVWRQPNLDAIKLEGLTPEQVYDQIAAEAFDSFGEKFTARLFKDASTKR